MRHALLQRAVALVYPSECVLCRAPAGSDFGFCSDCVRDAPFISGPICDRCGVPIMVGEIAHGDETCDDCLAMGRPWQRARAVFRYTGNGRRIVLALKHGDRTDLVRAAQPWMLRAAKPLLVEDPLVVPVPLHPWRQLKRRYNQAAELGRRLAHAANIDYAPDGLRRTFYTPSLDHKPREERHEVLRGAISANGDSLRGRSILLVDDVMTSGATLGASADAALAAGASRVDCLVLASVEKSDASL